METAQTPASLQLKSLLGIQGLAGSPPSHSQFSTSLIWVPATRMSSRTWETCTGMIRCRAMLQDEAMLSGGGELQ